MYASRKGHQDTVKVILQHDCGCGR
ncbi:MAG TPA: hypothetical protein EYO59_10725 [Chromatiaceae bacterium]|nr:hypothetical protein [Chromatiaceae bacterium]